MAVSTIKYYIFSHLRCISSCDACMCLVSTIQLLCNSMYLNALICVGKSYFTKRVIVSAPLHGWLNNSSKVGDHCNYRVCAISTFGLTATTNTNRTYDITSTLAYGAYLGASIGQKTIMYICAMELRKNRISE